MLADIDAAALKETEANFAKSFGRDQVRSAIMDVTDENAVAAAYAHAADGIWRARHHGLQCRNFVGRADRRDRARVWDRNMDILGKGYFLVSRDAFRLMKKQKLGGAIVFIASKNGLAAWSTPRPIARPRPRRSTWLAASLSKARNTASASTWSIPMRSCAAPASGRASGGSSAPPPTT